MEVIEHTQVFGPNGRCAFAEEWFKLTGGWVPSASSIYVYWLRRGLFKQAG